MRHAIEEAGDGRLSVRLTTDVYAYFVHVSVPDERVRRDDDFVELEPGGERTLVLDGVRPEDVEVRAR